ncbi:MAG TPA: EexN family lipoprotein [Steroidobacteraceae bacterium]|jgi:hypothetical protein
MTNSQHVSEWKGALCFAMTSITIACTRSPEVATPTVTYFREHEDDRREVMKRCTDDPGTLGKTPTCVNARQAALMEGIGTFRNLPQMELPAEQASKGPSTAPGAASSPRR